MPVPTRRLPLVCLLITLFLGFSGSVTAQRNPTMPSQFDDSSKEALYSDFLANKKVPNAEKQRLAYEAAKEYVRRFSADRDSNLVETRRFVLEYERVKRHYELYTVFSAKNYSKTFEIGREILAKDSDDFYTLGLLSMAGSSSAGGGDASLNEETVRYSKKALELLDSPDVKKSDPFPSMEEARDSLNSTVGWLLKDQAPVEAAAALVRAIKVNGSSSKNPRILYFLATSILKGEYAQLSAEYNTKFGNKPPSPEQQAMLERLMKVGDRAVDAYARAVALSSGPKDEENRRKLMTQLTSLYKNFHNGSDAGLDALVSSVLTKPLPE